MPAAAVLPASPASSARCIASSATRAPRRRLHAPWAAADILREGRVARTHRAHQGPDGRPHPRAHGARGRLRPRSDRRGDERQHRHLVRGHRAGARPPVDLHARLDERRAQGPDPKLRRRDRRVSREPAGSSGHRRGRPAAADDPRTFLPQQFSNDANVEAHRLGTGPEIWTSWHSTAVPRRVRRRGRHRGHCHGRRAALRDRAPGCACTPSSRRSRPPCPPAARSGTTGSRASPDEFVPAICRLDELDAVDPGQRRGRDPHGAGAGPPRPCRGDLVGGRTSWARCGCSPPWRRRPWW